MSVTSKNTQRNARHGNIIIAGSSRAGYGDAHCIYSIVVMIRNGLSHCLDHIIIIE